MTGLTRHKGLKPGEPQNRSLVLFETDDDVAVWFRDDRIADESWGAPAANRWFMCGDYDTVPQNWEDVIRKNAHVQPVLLVRAPGWLR